MVAADEPVRGSERTIPDSRAGPSTGGASTDPEVSGDTPVPRGGQNLPIRRFADLSTAHLTRDLADRLAEECARQAVDRATEGMTPVWELGTGFLAWVPDPAFDGARIIDPVLARILDVARTAGADYVLFDRDARICPDLPSFDW